MAKVRWIILSLFSVSTSYACELYQSDFESESVLFHSKSGVCFSLLEGIQYSAQKVDALTKAFEQKPIDYSEYWSDWVLKSASNPVLTKSLESNYFGVGIWKPSELEESLDSLTPEEWLMNHGVQFSLGFGDKEIGKPRMRFDYRWHSEYKGDLLMQVEVPF